MKIQEVLLSELHVNPDNPRTISPEKLEKLKKSITEFPQMLKIRPTVADASGMIIGGNMRFIAAKELGMKMIPVIYVNDLTEEQKREFIIKDNIGFGEWDFDDLQSNWDVSVLEDWGLDFPDFAVDPPDFVLQNEQPDYSSKNKEIDINRMEKQFSVSFTYDAETFYRVTQFISSIAETPEEALLLLIESYGK